MKVDFVPIPGAPYAHDYISIFNAMACGDIPRDQKIPTYRKLCQEDLFFLLYFGLNRIDVNHPWLVSRIREVEAVTDNCLDLWAREHYKSSFRTYGQPLQDIIKDPEERICIFSHTRPIAKGFLRQIKQTCENDYRLIQWFDDVFWANPKREAPKWSEDDGLIFKRRGTYKESSIEAWGLIDGQ